MGPPRTYPIDAENRERFREWLATEWGGFDPPTIGEMIRMIESGKWRDPQLICPATFYTLEPADLDLVRKATAERIAAEPGSKWRDGGVMYDSDGETFHATLLM